MSEKSSLFDWVKSRKVFVRSILRCLIELGDVRRFVRRILRYSIELRAVRSLFGKMCGIR